MTAAVPVSERRGYIGGSDWYELLSGCELRLWKVKRGAAGPEQTGAMLRGHKLEPLIVDEYAARTGRRVRRENRLLVNPDYPWECAHIDRFTWPHTESIFKGRGVLEAKSANPWMFRSFQTEGLPDHYISQMQHYLGVTGCKWGAYAILEPVEWQFETFEILRDDALIQAMRERSGAFWRLVENGPAPEKLEPASKPCRKCRFRAECHPYEPVVEDLGDAVRDDDIEPLAAKLADARRIVRDAKAFEDECAEALTEALGERRNVVAGDLVVIRQTTPRAGYTVAPTNVTTIRVKERK